MNDELQYFELSPPPVSEVVRAVCRGCLGSDEDLLTRRAKLEEVRCLGHLEIVSVVVDVVRDQLVVDPLAGEAPVTEAVGGSEDPELVDESSTALVRMEPLWRTGQQRSGQGDYLTVELNIGVPRSVPSVTASNNPESIMIHTFTRLLATHYLLSSLPPVFAYSLILRSRMRSR